MFFADDSDLLVNTTGILADQVTIESNNSTVPIFTLGKRGILGQTPQGPIRSDINISYYPEHGNDPNIQALKTIKNLSNSSLWSGVPIDIGGISGNRCYLTNYNIRAIPNQITKASVQYILFNETSGELQRKRATTTYNPSGLWVHGWTTFIVARSGYLSSPTYEFEYNFVANWNPTYILGQETPTQIDLIDGQETMRFVRDDYYNNVTFSGEEPHNSFITYTGFDTHADIMAVELLCETPAASGSDLSFQVTGTRITSSITTIRTDDFIRTTYQVNNYF